jgi:type II secretory pathway pseudopilin PulG
MGIHLAPRSLMTSPSRSPASERGVSESGIGLVEVLMAMLVLIIGLVAVAQLLVVATVARADAAATTGATLDAQDKLEELVATGLASPALQVTTTDTLTANVADYFDRTAAGRTRRWRVEAGPVAGTRIVRVRVLDPTFGRFGARAELLSMVRRR